MSSIKPSTITSVENMLAARAHTSKEKEVASSSYWPSPTCPTSPSTLDSSTEARSDANMLSSLENLPFPADISQQAQTSLPVHIPLNQLRSVVLETFEKVELVAKKLPCNQNTIKTKVSNDAVSTLSYLIAHV
jgi:hypothetical protein